MNTLSASAYNASISASTELGGAGTETEGDGEPGLSSTPSDEQPASTSDTAKATTAKTERCI
ncbi:hypothetical protein brsh051_03680 [Brooklawnia propionicigenes]|uniref:Uncharacterized protein n=1 Tax=Brooklawnia propionicigenes TaxID=3041175 RepID=A0AAN0K8I5_9ACTN|nr:hypothetical protein brsh051_03680 [Brooklawnia sp. SH051]